MPKLKNHRGAKKRFSVTGTGKLMRMHQGNTHFRRRKARRVSALFDKKEPVAAADVKRIARLLPHVS